MNEFELFQSALDLEDPAARKSFLTSACGHDRALLNRVEALLASHDEQSQFLNTPVVEQITDVVEGEAASTMLLGDASTQDDEPEVTEAQIPGSAPMTTPSDDPDDEIPLGYLEPSSNPDSLGRLGHYEILEVIGRGAFGTVLRALDEKLQRVVAIKVMSPEMASTSPARKRFIREAQASAAIRHENVVSVHAVEEKPIPYLVMDYIPGQNLQQRLDEQGPLDVATVLRLGRQIAEGLAAAHGQDLIHRDVKPANILLESGVREMVKVTDFGLARAADDASLTQSGMIAGTPMYMAPEQALGKKLDQRADLFSFGSVLYQMVSGRPPFRADSTLAVLKRLNEDTPRPICEIIPETPQWLCDIITKLHAKNPDERYQTAREVADVLANCEFQLKAHAGLKDFSQIPVIPREKAQSAGRWKWLAVVAVVTVFPFLAWVLYNFNRSEVRPQVVANGTITRPPYDSPQTPGARKPERAASQIVIANQAQPPAAIAPFDAAQARVHQAAWAKHLGVPVEYTNSIGMKFVLIPPGEFMMGSTQQEMNDAFAVAGTDEIWKEHIRSEAPRHKVVLTRPVYLGVHEVTQAQYIRVMGPHAAYFSPSGIGARSVFGMDTENHPVETVSWNDAAEFCAKLSETEQLQADYARSGNAVSQIAGNGYRLPTEAVWEFACRAGTTANCWSGDQTESLLNSAWFKMNSLERTHAVGELKANPFGLYDIHGNVWEWVQDRWDVDYYNQFGEQAAIDPVGPAAEAGSRHGLRGGDWVCLLSSCRSSHRHVDSATARLGSVGFRVSLPVDAVKAALQRTPVAVAKQEVPSLAEHWVSLFNGKDLTGWQAHPVATAGAWRVDGEELVGGGNTSYLFYQAAEYDNFRLRAEFQVSQTGNGGVYLRAPLPGAGDGPHPKGYETQIIGPDAPVSNYKTGGLVNFPTQGAIIEADTWYSLDIQADGPRLVVRVNGVLTSDVRDGKHQFLRGHIALQLWEPGTTVRFRKIEIRELRPVSPETATPPLAIAPFDAAVARAHQAAWAKHLGVPVEYTNGLGMKFRLIPPGEFMMGSTAEEVKASIKAIQQAAPQDIDWQKYVQSESPQHMVVLTRPYYLGSHEVTQRDYEAVMGSNPSRFAKSGQTPEIVARADGLDTTQFAVESVSWNDAAEFCARLSQRDQLKPVYFRAGNTVTNLDGNGYRLPTEAQWEFGCRAGTTTKFSGGDGGDRDLLPSGWFWSNAGQRMHSVGELKANQFGLFDMHGNASEFVADAWGPGYYEQFAVAPATDPAGVAVGDGERINRIIRGGFWSSGARECRSGSRFANDQLGASEHVGFRVVLPVEAVREASMLQKINDKPADEFREDLK